MSDSTLSLFDFEEMKAENGLPWEAFTAFCLKYARATEAVLLTLNMDPASMFEKVRWYSRKWQKLKFFIKYMAATQDPQLQEDYFQLAERFAYVSGHREGFQKAVVRLCDRLWSNLEIYYCPRMEVMQRLMASTIKQI